jgi:predicted Zn-dependent peptidase
MRKIALFFFGLSLFQMTALDAQAEKYIFPNGLRLLHKSTGANQIVAIEVFIDVGSIDEYIEDKNKLGIRNFVQSVITKGTKKYSATQINELIESIGGKLFTDTAEDYMEICAIVTKPYFEVGINLIYEIYCNPTFPYEEVEKGREDIMASIFARNEDIFTTTYDVLNKLLYNDHPYAFPVVGTTETVKNITVCDLKKFHKKYFTPQNTIISVVGDIDFNVAKYYVEKSFGKIPAKTKKAHKVLVSSEPLHADYVESREVERECKGKFKQAYIMIGYVAPEASSPDYSKVKMLSAMLGGGMSSRLFTEIREKNAYAYEVSSFYPTRKHKSRFVIYMGLDRKFIQEAKDNILREVEKMKISIPDEEEIRRIKNYVRGTYIMAHVTNRQQAWYLGWWELVGRGYEYDTKYIDDILSISREELKAAAEKLFSKPVIVKMLPEE